MICVGIGSVDIKGSYLMEHFDEYFLVLLIYSSNGLKGLLIFIVVSSIHWVTSISLLMCCPYGYPGSPGNCEETSWVDWNYIYHGGWFFDNLYLFLNAVLTSYAFFFDLLLVQIFFVLLVFIADTCAWGIVF